MRIVLACDHAGFEMKERTRVFLLEQGYDVVDCGAYEYDAMDDYPLVIAKAAQEVSQSPFVTRGIVFGGSGQGEAIVANKFPHVRAVVYMGEPTTVGQKGSYTTLMLTRTHNNANILSLGARFLSPADLEEVVRVWLTTPFSEDERHQRRVEEIEHIESSFIA